MRVAVVARHQLVLAACERNFLEPFSTRLLFLASSLASYRKRHSHHPFQLRHAEVVVEYGPIIFANQLHK